MGNYIGNARVLEIFTRNVRDDLVPEETAPGIWKSSFELSQEVPGGSGENILVLRHEWKIDQILSDVTTVDFVVNAGDDSIESTDPETVLMLAHLQDGKDNAGTQSNESDYIIISGAVASLGQNNGRHKIKNITYNESAPSIKIEVQSTLVDEVGATISIERGYYLPWEVLDPSNDYYISGDYSTPTIIV